MEKHKHMKDTEVIDIDTLPRADALVVFTDFKKQVDELVDKGKDLVVSDVSETDKMKEARELRLSLKHLRVDIEKRRKELGEEALRRKQRIDGDAKALKDAIEPVEKHLQAQEDFIELMEAAHKEELRAQRAEQLEQYCDPAMYLLGEMDQPAFDAMLNGMKLAHEAKIAEEAKANAEAEAKEKAEAKERERIRQENARLKAEAEAREAELAKEREAAEAERKKQEAILAKERADAAEKQAAIEAEANKQREKADAERRAQEEAARKAQEAEEAKRKEAEAKLEAIRKAEEDRLRAEEEKAREAAAAPDRDRLRAFAESIRELQVPAVNTPELQPAAKLIAEKTNAFADWILKQIGEVEAK